MNKRRDFLVKAGALGGGILLAGCGASTNEVTRKSVKPLVISTWKFGTKANNEAWKLLSNKGTALDAVEAGVKIIEADPKEQSVGYGGRPDREGKVTLDACIMDHKANIGAVLCMEHIVHAVSVARAVMEHTPHVMLSGQGALDFALSRGFEAIDLLTPESKAEYEKWLRKGEYKPKVNIENHDTIGMLTLDEQGNLAGACTTSGMAYKMHGRIGDSPIIGAGLYVDNEVGAATATGHGEEVVRVVGSFLVVELMRGGMTPQAACEEAVKRIEKKFKTRGVSFDDTQIGFIAINTHGEYGAFCLRPGFNFAVKSAQEEQLIDAKALIP